MIGIIPLKGCYATSLELSENRDFAGFKLHIGEVKEEPLIFYASESEIQGWLSYFKYL
jgi:hypothetical protein